MSRREDSEDKCQKHPLILDALETLMILYAESTACNDLGTAVSGHQTSCQVPDLCADKKLNTCNSLVVSGWKASSKRSGAKGRTKNPANQGITNLFDWYGVIEHDTGSIYVCQTLFCFKANSMRRGHRHSHKYVCTWIYICMYICV